MLNCGLITCFWFFGNVSQFFTVSEAFSELTPISLLDNQFVLTAMCGGSMTRGSPLISQPDTQLQSTSSTESTFRAANIAWFLPMYDSNLIQKVKLQLKQNCLVSSYCDNMVLRKAELHFCSKLRYSQFWIIFSFSRPVLFCIAFTIFRLEVFSSITAQELNEVIKKCFL